MPSKYSFKNIEDYREYYRQYREKNKEKLQKYNKEYTRVWRSIHGNHHDLVRGVVARAVRKGTLIKLACEVCGNVKSQGHHEDYSKPLEVIWLCSVHHKERHIKDIPSNYSKFILK